VRRVRLRKVRYGALLRLAHPAHRTLRTLRTVRTKISD
jgi:hypothetical protein